MKRYIAILFSFLFFVLLLPLLTPIQKSQALTPNYAPDEVIVKYKSNVSESEKDNLRKRIKSRSKHKIEKLRMEVMSLQEGTVTQTIETLKNDPDVEYAEPNYQATKLLATNDSALSQQWGLFKINAANSATSSAWDVTTGSTTVKVAILDSGIETTHSDLAGKVVTSTNFTTSATSSDLDGHGTHVAGIVAAATNNGAGVAGTGYDTVLINGKVLGDNGTGFYSWIANGITWAADQGAQVISMSLAGTAPSKTMEDAINYAWSKGAVVVAAAGNSNSSTPNYPAFYTNVIAVAATDNQDKRASFSTYGNWVDVAAPGVSIYSTYKGNSYALMSGTSMATPFVAGTAALVFATGTCTTNICVRNRIEQTADKITGTGSSWTWGRINAYNAVTNIVATPSPTNAPTPTNTPNPTNIPTLTRTPTPTLTPTLIPTKNITVGEITMSYASQKVSTIISVINRESNAPLSFATVKISLKAPSGTISNSTGFTNSSGKVTFNSMRTSEKGIFTSTVTNVSKIGFTYFPVLTSQTLLVQ